VRYQDMLLKSPLDEAHCRVIFGLLAEEQTKLDELSSR
jgi:hypothetical protein